MKQKNKKNEHEPFKTTNKGKSIKPTKSFIDSMIGGNLLCYVKNVEKENQQNLKNLLTNSLKGAIIKTR